MGHRALLLFVSLWSSGLCADDKHLPAVTAKVRLVGGASRCAGRLERKEHGEWTEVDDWFIDWNLTAAAAVCRQLDCGAVILVQRTFDNSIQIKCSESVRLVEGTNVCSGRLEVKSDQSWSSVCEDDFNQQNAEVVCRELGCGAPSVFKGGLYGAAEAPVWMRKFQCGGHESALLDCGSSRSTENSCSPGKAVGLTCSDPDVRLVGGANRCSGRLQVKQNGEWKEVDITSADWTMKKIAAICRQLDCGSPVSIKTSHRTTRTEVLEDEQHKHVGEDYISSNQEICCSDSVRLVEGTNVCSGRLEVKSDQSWSSVCEDDFNQQNAEVVCRELGCGAPSVFKGGLYGAAEAPVWMRKFQCGGHESALLDCGSSQTSCSPGKAVGLTCSDPDDVRLMGGANRCSGRLELKQHGVWKEVSRSDWTMKKTAVICQQLNCGSLVSIQVHTSERPSNVESKSQSKGYTITSEVTRSHCLEITCSESVRLVEGMCSGRLEVKSDQSWSSVCEDDFNQQNAEVVCRELGCGDPLVLQGVPYRASEPRVWSKEFHCEGNESALLECDSSSSATKEELQLVSSLLLYFLY
ncbi:scavenger receptor cysteine-rich type 1 protein M130-like [Parambassis ranga]|uniref:Scavenger receptor cysteine-rich type 1 protein M130-like n=1 Tax=Parambassis ranga TaxID=210632 RepID=A0A6P7JG87_9TELE|nr:scavenger receptor cysteine-rich type 1 protein M130-like [Parambassis ranga]